MKGWPAFTHEHKYGDGTARRDDGTARRDDGMTLRDYFAASAMQAVITAGLSKTNIDFDDAARAGYLFADAMLAAREVTP